MKEMMSGKKKIFYILFLILIFGITFFYFSSIHKLVIFDSDDWTIATKFRVALPKWGYWNPTRVLPELVYSFVSAIGAYVVYPISGDYIRSMEIVHAIAVSLVITCYVLCFAVLICKRYAPDIFVSIGSGILFFLFHFFIFRGELNGQNAFLSRDVCCYYYYTIPSLINGMIVMVYLMGDVIPKLHDKRYYKWGSIFVVVCYLALFSNMFCNIITVVFFGVTLLYDFILAVKTKGFCSDFWRKIWFRVVYLLGWIVVLIFEANGGRANCFSENTSKSFVDAVKSTIVDFLRVRFQMNAVFFIILAVLVGIFVVICCKYRREERTKKALSSLIMMSVSCGLVTIFLILLCAKTERDILRAEILLAVVVYIILIFCEIMQLVLCHVKYLYLAIPMTILLVASRCNDASAVIYRDSNTVNYSAELCEKVSNGILAQYRWADQNNLNGVVLYVPDFYTEGNWPIEMNIPDCSMSKTLYKHNVVSRLIPILEIKKIPLKEFLDLTVYEEDGSLPLYDEEFTPDTVSNGWVMDKRGIWYRCEDGTYYKNEFANIGDYTYAFDSNGYLCFGWVLQDGNWYYFEEQYGMLASTWFNDRGKYCYFSEEGVMVNNWRMDGYYIDFDGYRR